VTPATTSYDEKLTPSPSLWCVAGTISGSLGLTVLPVAGPVGAIALGAGAVAATTWALLRSSARIRLQDGVFRAGKARIPAGLLGRAVAVDARQMSALRGPQANARAYLCQRAWVREGVLIEIADPQDPVPYWLVSSRRPQDLVSALPGPAGPGPATARQIRSIPGRPAEWPSRRTAGCDA
jgi:hypothetical protein